MNAQSIISSTTTTLKNGILSSTGKMITFQTSNNNIIQKFYPISFSRNFGKSSDNNEDPKKVKSCPTQNKPPSQKPTDQLVRAILGTEDMKRVIGRELRKCGGMIEQIDYSRMLYDSWNGYTEQVILSHIGSKEKLLQLIQETMKEDPVFRSYIENVLQGKYKQLQWEPSRLTMQFEGQRLRTYFLLYIDRLRSRPLDINLPGGKHLPWIMAGVSLLAALFNYYFTAFVLFIGKISWFSKVMANNF